MFRHLQTSLLTSLLALLLAACSADQSGEQVVDKPRLGLFTSLPIYWGEGDIAEMLEGGKEPDWVRAELETRFELVPLDTLEPEALAGLDRVILAQPRPLAPSENVSFDDWLARGGRAVILADPMLTRHSRYPLGDRRRPQDVVLLSPILGRWGIELLFDEGQPAGERIVAAAGHAFPVNLRGRFARRETEDPARSCTVYGDGLLAQCVRGRGKAVLYADAALLDWEGDGAVPQARRDALRMLVQPIEGNPPGAAHAQE